VTSGLPLRAYAVAWVPLFAVYFVLFTVSGTPPLTGARYALVSVLPYAILGVLVLEVPRRVPWRDEGRGLFISLQLALALAYAVASTGVGLMLRVADSFVVARRVDIRLDLLVVAWQAVVGGLLYASLAGAAYAWENAQRVREAAARAARAEALRARAELAALRSQLNPHFLLNTLHAALGLVRRDPALAERALERLGELLHYGLRMHREGLDQVTLGEEWAFVRSYLEIEGLRLEERLQLRLEAEPETLECPVPPFVLQPLVENAVLHAVAPRKQGGRIEVTARLRGERLQLEVCDDGPGMPAAASTPGAGLGLQLLRDRLAQLYGGKAALSLHTAESGGVRATLDLPLDFEASVEPS